MRKYENVTFWHSDREKIEQIASIKVATIRLLFDKSQIVNGQNQTATLVSKFMH